MNGRFLLDTNIVIALFAEDRSVQGYVREAEEVFIPSIVLCELWFGARKSGQVKQNLERIDDFAAKNTVLACDRETARHYGMIKDTLRGKGRLIPENDIWIAGIAQQNDLTLITRDEHFHKIEQLKIEVWQ